MDTGGNMMMDGMGVFFGLFGILYIAFALFITILMIVFLFKAMSFMKHKTESDRKLIEAINRFDTKTNRMSRTNTIGEE